MTMKEKKGFLKIGPSHDLADSFLVFGRHENMTFFSIFLMVAVLKVRDTSKPRVRNVVQAVIVTEGTDECWEL